RHRRADLAGATSTALLGERQMHDGGGIDVTPSTLLDASSQITSKAGDLRFWVGQVRQQGGGAQASLDAVLAGAAWSEVTSSWGAALDRLVTALAAYGS